MNKTLKLTDLFWLAFTGLVALAPLVPAIAANSFLMHVLILVLLYASMAQAWNIIGGYGGQTSFGHAVFFGIGAYGAGMAVVTYGLPPWPGALIGWRPPWWPCSSATPASS
jgi:branched-chain amino acid transport system permease protein